MTKAPEPDDETLEVWETWFDAKETSILDAIHVFEIDVDTRVDAGGEPEVEFEQFNARPRQVQILDIIQKKFWAKERTAARLVCLKARRYGLTSFFLLFALERILRVPGYNVALIAQDDDTAQEHFSRVRDFYSQVPKGVLKARGIQVVQDTHQRIVLRHEGNRTSRMRIATAQRRALGRGLRNNLLILTEFPQWRPSAKRDLSGLLRTCSNARGNAVIFESTAQGFDEFYDRYKRAKKPGSSYRAVFVASFENPANRKKFATPKDEVRFIASIATLKEYGAEDESVLWRRLLHDENWTPRDAAEYLNWRRTVIADEFNGSISWFKREEPNTEDEAFLGTGQPIFRKDILEAWRPQAEKREEEALKCRLVVKSDKAEIVEEFNGELAVFELPEKGARYAFGADVASGIQVQSDNRTEADFSYVCVKNVKTRATVARFRAQLPEGEFAVAAFRLACFYAMRGYIERSINSSGVTITRFEEMELGEFSGAELLLGQKELVSTDTATQRKNWLFTTGFRTTQKSKPLLVERIRDLVRDTGAPDGKKPCPWDLQFIDEALKFERVGRSGKMEAAKGHDDAVISEGLALEACARISEDDDGTPGDDPPPEGPEDPYMMLVRHSQMSVANERATDDDAEANDIPGLPGF